jgi:hypothetical protein
MSVQNEDIWDKVRKNLVRGFSIEGYFADKLQRPQDKQKEKLNEEQQLVKAIKDVLQNG